MLSVVDFTSVTASGSLQANYYIFIASYLVTGDGPTAGNNEEPDFTRFIQTGRATDITAWTDSPDYLLSTLPDNVKRKIYKVPNATTGSVGVFKWTYGSNTVTTIRMRSTGE